MDSFYAWFTDVCFARFKKAVCRRSKAFLVFPFVVENQNAGQPMHVGNIKYDLHPLLFCFPPPLLLRVPYFKFGRGQGREMTMPFVIISRKPERASRTANELRRAYGWSEKLSPVRTCLAVSQRVVAVPVWTVESSSDTCLASEERYSWGIYVEYNERICKEGPR